MIFQESNNRKVWTFSILLILILYFQLSQSQYEIPSYYGFWSKDFYKAVNITTGKFTIFQLHFPLDMNYDSTKVYYADKVQHCIYEYELLTRKNAVVAGKCSKSGDKVGDTSNTLFNSPSSIVYYRPDPQRYANLSNMKVYVTNDEQCQLADYGCVLSWQKANLMTLTLENIRFQPEINLFTINQDFDDEYLFISDTMNHCIKRITLKTTYTEVVAGICGESGFLDGPLGINRLNKPSNIGIDAQGVIYFFDEGNKYMRKINLKNEVETLLNGACTEYKRKNSNNRKVYNSFQLKKMICYSDWIEKETAASEQHYFDEQVLNFCTQHSSKCGINNL